MVEHSTKICSDFFSCSEGPLFPWSQISFSEQKKRIWSLFSYLCSSFFFWGLFSLLRLTRVFTPPAKNASRIFSFIFFWNGYLSLFSNFFSSRCCEEKLLTPGFFLWWLNFFLNSNSNKHFNRGLQCLCQRIMRWCSNHCSR